MDQRLPKALALKKKVDGGAVLEEADLAFLEEVLADAQKVAPIVTRNPKYLGVAGRVAKLYQEITANLENEQARKKADLDGGADASEGGFEPCDPRWVGSQPR